MPLGVRWGVEKGIGRLKYVVVNPPAERADTLSFSTLPLYVLCGFISQQGSPAEYTVASTTFWCTFRHDGKISQGW